MNYNHTAADALDLASFLEFFEAKNVSLSAEAVFLATTALKFWAEHQPKFKVNDKVVFISNRELSYIFNVDKEFKKDGYSYVILSSCFDIDSERIVPTSFVRNATDKEISADYRFDKNLTDVNEVQP